MWGTKDIYGKSGVRLNGVRLNGVIHMSLLGQFQGDSKVVRIIGKFGKSGVRIIGVLLYI